MIDVIERPKFKAGDRVTHITVGDGVVTRCGNGQVEVRFQNLVGIYDNNWFGLHPGWLQPTPKMARS